MNNKLEIILAAKNHTSKTFAQVRKGLGGLTSAVFSLNGALVTLGAGGALTYSLSKFATLDKGLIGVQKTTNMTSEEIKQLEDELVNMSMRIPVTTAKLLEIAEAAGQLGVKGVKDVALFTETMAKLEITSDIVGAEGAKSLARLLNTAGEGTDKIDELGSVVVALGNNMAASEKEIVHMAGEIGRSVSSYNVASEASLAWGAALKAMGARAEGSGSAIGKAMIMIDKAITNGGEKFEYLQHITGMTGDQIKKTFETDASRVFNAWIVGMNKMTKNGKSAVSILGEFGFAGVETIKGLTPLIKNVEQLEKAFNIANKEVKDATALDYEAIKASESFSAQMTLTWNAVDKVASKIGQGLAPEIVKLTKEFRNWVEVNDDFISQDLPAYISKIMTASGFVIDSIAGVGRAFTLVGKGFAVTALYMEKGFWEISDTIVNGPIAELNKFLELYNQIPGMPDLDLISNSDLGKNIKDNLKRSEEAIRIAKQDIIDLLEEPLPSLKIAQSFEASQVLAAQKQKEQDNQADLQKSKPGGYSKVDFNNGGDNSGGGFKGFSDEIKAYAERKDWQHKTLTDMWAFRREGEQTLSQEEIEASTAYKETVQANLDSIGMGYSELYSDINDKPLWAEFEEGAANAMANIKESVMSTAEVVEYGLTGAVNGIADAFGEWASGAKTFKDAFKDMAKNVIADLVSMIVKQAIYNALQSGSNSGSGSGGSSGGAVAGSVVSSVVTAMFHGGGVAGSGEGMPKMMPALAFAGAPRFPSGLMPDEFAAILKKDEGVFTPKQMEALGKNNQASQKARSIKVTNNFHVTPDARGNISKQSQQQMASSTYRGMRKASRRQ